MKVLVLDDNPYRHATFAKTFVDHEVTHVTHALKCIDIIQAERFDVIHLDHDLGDFEDEHGSADYWVDGWGSRREYNGQNVASEIASLPAHMCPGEVVVHSVNPEGARRMVSIIAAAGIPVTWQPFGDTAESYEGIT